MRRSLLAAILLTGLALFYPEGVLRDVSAQETIELRIATLAPQGSSWMRVFNAWNRSL
ncbi:MAG: hypothetical protein H5U40_14935 [Polyangiaceae bacterium]|nr:hypothetical protein [Polyangiaceae bacterium]